MSSVNTRRFPTLVLLTLLSSALHGCALRYQPGAPLTPANFMPAPKPVALLTVPKGESPGTIAGRFPGWPFADPQPPAGLSGSFTYVGRFKVTQHSPTTAMPTAASGSRSIYFSESEHGSLANSASLALGQVVATEDIGLSFSFDPDSHAVTVRVTARQTSAKTFEYHEQTIVPPLEAAAPQTLGGPYSPEYGGYLLYVVR